MSLFTFPSLKEEISKLSGRWNDGIHSTPARRRVHFVIGVASSRPSPPVPRVKAASRLSATLFCRHHSLRLIRLEAVGFGVGRRNRRESSGNDSFLLLLGTLYTFVNLWFNCALTSVENAARAAIANIDKKNLRIQILSVIIICKISKILSDKRTPSAKSPQRSQSYVKKLRALPGLFPPQSAQRARRKIKNLRVLRVILGLFSPQSARRPQRKIKNLRALRGLFPPHSTRRPHRKIKNLRALRVLRGLFSPRRSQRKTPCSPWSWYRLFNR